MLVTLKLRARNLAFDPTETVIVQQDHRDNADGTYASHDNVSDEFLHEHPKDRDDRKKEEEEKNGKSYNS